MAFESPNYPNKINSFTPRFSAHYYTAIPVAIFFFTTFVSSIFATWTYYPSIFSHPSSILHCINIVLPYYSTVNFSYFPSSLFFLLSCTPLTSQKLHCHSSYFIFCFLQTSEKVLLIILKTPNPNMKNPILYYV